jgi:hypothetical protein
MQHVVAPTDICPQSHYTDMSKDPLFALEICMQLRVFALMVSHHRHTPQLKRYHALLMRIFPSVCAKKQI